MFTKMGILVVFRHSIVYNDITCYRTYCVERQGHPTMAGQSSKFRFHKTNAFRKAAKRWDAELDRSVKERYALADKPLPPEYESSADALKALEDKRTAWKLMMTENGKPNAVMGVAEAVDILIDTVAMTVQVGSGENSSLLVYNYDSGVYEYSTSTLNQYIVKLLNKSSNQIISSVNITLIGRKQDLALFNPLPEHRVGVGNGIYNFITGQLEPYNPMWTTLTKISTDYVPGYKLPESFGELTFDKLVNDLANYNPERIELLHQICMAIFTGHNVAPALFLIQGDGGDGKSTFFQMISAVLGPANVANVNFRDLEAQDKLIECANTKLVLGLDNDANLYIKNTSVMKSMSSHETMTISRKYLNAIAVRFTATFVQICNDMPRFAETGDAIQRRVVVFKAENSHYKHGTDKPRYDKDVLRPEFLIHVLSTILDETHISFYTNYNEVDKEVLDDALNVDDILGQFMSDLDMMGVFGPQVSTIPLTHLFAAYKAWLASSAPGTSGLSARGFAHKSTRVLKQYGFARDNVRAVIRPSSLENNGEYSPAIFGYLRESQQFEEALKFNAPTRVISRKGERTIAVGANRSAGKRNAKVCSVYEFFGIDDTIEAYMKKNEKELYKTYKEECEKLRGKIIKVGEVKLEVQENVLNDVAKAPANIAVAYNNGDIDSFDAVIEWLKKIDNLARSEDDAMLNETIRATYDNVSMLADQISQSSKDPQLILYAENAKFATVANQAQGLIEFIEQLKRNIETKRKHDNDGQEQ